MNEYGKLKLEGVDVIGKCVDIKISNFVCDASARAFCFWPNFCSSYVLCHDSPQRVCTEREITC